jgi:hypothetical protein
MNPRRFFVALIALAPLFVSSANRPCFGQAFTASLTGTPLNYTAPGLGFGFGYNPPIITKGSDVPLSNRTPERWFNTAAFSQPAPFTMGTAPRRITDLRQDSVHSADVGIMKNFTLWEPLRLQFRAESFNLSNTPQFGRPNVSVGSATFGQVTSTWASGRQVQFGLRLSF